MEGEKATPTKKTSQTILARRTYEEHRKGNKGNGLGDRVQFDPTLLAWTPLLAE